MQDRNPSDSTAPFWLGLFNLGADTEHRAHLWNGYLSRHLPPRTLTEPPPGSGWPRLFVPPPEGGWPNLTDEEVTTIEELAGDCGGHPVLNHHYMDFARQRFFEAMDFSGLTFIEVTFEEAQFEEKLSFSSQTRCFAQCWFRRAEFRGQVSVWGSRFHGPVYFDGASFDGMTSFVDVRFLGGAFFVDAVFRHQVDFNDSRFEQLYWSSGMMPPCLADFTNARFRRENLFSRSGIW